MVDKVGRPAGGDGQGCAIRVPSYRVEMVRELGLARRELAADLRREPNEGEIARRLGWGVEKVRLTIGSMPDAMSLDWPVGIESVSVGDFSRTCRPPTHQAP